MQGVYLSRHGVPSERLARPLDVAQDIFALRFPDVPLGLERIAKGAAPARAEPAIATVSNLQQYQPQWRAYPRRSLSTRTPVLRCHFDYLKTLWRDVSATSSNDRLQAMQSLRLRKLIGHGAGQKPSGRGGRSHLIDP